MDDSPNPLNKTPFPLDGPLSKDLGSKNNRGAWFACHIASPSAAEVASVASV